MTSNINTTPIFQHKNINDNVEKEPKSNGEEWSSLYFLSSPKDSSSVPPLSQHISKKSKSGVKSNLGMCTEILGCETGTMHTANEHKRDGVLSDKIRFLTLEEGEERSRERKAMVEKRIKRAKSGTELPPPMMTIRTRETFLSIVRKRENGKMVMYTARQQSMVTTERKDGRLKLHLIPGCNEKCVFVGTCKEGENADDQQPLRVVSVM